MTKDKAWQQAVELVKLGTPAYHVYKTAEEHLHVLSGYDCPCNPKIELCEWTNLIIHNRMDN